MPLGFPSLGELALLGLIKASSTWRRKPGLVCVSRKRPMAPPPRSLVWTHTTAEAFPGNATRGPP